MQLFKKKCELCKVKIEKGKEFLEIVKVPELTDFRERPFCSKKHAKFYKECVIATPRTNYCPGCGI